MAADGYATVSFRRLVHSKKSTSTNNTCALTEGRSTAGAASVRAHFKVTESTDATVIQFAVQTTNDPTSWTDTPVAIGSAQTGDGSINPTSWDDVSTTLNGKLYFRFVALVKNQSGTNTEIAMLEGYAESRL